ncbi:ninein-like protein isoform X5 [Scyliorhinus canicula]|uniref:ninein-like protein isoform X5 n=1 Tax=Scyliorhinus canicula TaxID=7830 RepID=UPI0018F61BBD|nr:ninein-like protein isoform X5 [Scyliorhinus canicula]
MDEAEQNKYVLQLKDVFDSCDTTGTGYLDSGELTELCQKLHLEAQIPLLLQTLLGSNHHGRVNFEDFKEGFVAVLSTSINLSISEDESSYFEPATPKEIEPKYIKGTKRYGRRSVPEFLDSEVETTDDLEEPLHFKAAKDEMFLQSANRSHLRHSASLESVESLKSDEEMEHHKEPLHETFEAPGRLSKWNPNDFDSPRRFSTPCPEATESHVQAIWDELGVGKNGYLNTEELATVCDNIGLKDLENKEVAELFRKLDKDGDGKVNLSEFLVGLFRHEPVTSFPSTLYKQKYRRALYQTFHENRWRTSTPSLVSKTVGAQLFSGLDDGTGYASPEQIIDMWQEDGITNSQEILEALAFDVEEKVNLADLTKALENELLASKTGIHQAALACYKNEINYLQGQIQQLHKERDKVKVDLDRAEKRNVQLAKDVDDQHSAMESLNETKLKHLDQGYKEKMTAVKLELDREQELITQQVNTQRAELEHEIDSLRSEEIHFQEKLKLTMKENSRLQKELVETVEKLTESEKLVSRLQKDLDYVLKEKFGTLDHPSLEIFGQEQRFSELIMQYEQQCRRVKELRDRNDELQTEMQVLHKQLHHRNHHYAGNKKNSIYRGTDSSIIRCESVPDKVPPEGECANVSIKAEIAMEQLRKQHVQELHDLRIQLQTKVNYYEREIELMKRNFEKERKYVEQSFKIEISELEDQRMAREQEMERLQGVVNELCVQQQQGEATQEEAITALLKKHETVKVNLQEELRKEQMENLKYKMEELKKGGELNKMFEAWAKTKLVFQMQEQEKRFEWEKTEQQRAFAKEKSELEQRLTKEKLQMEKELKLQHQKELQQLRYESEMLSEENSSLKRKMTKFHQEFQDVEGKVDEQRKQVEQLKNERECRQREFEELQKRNKQYVAEIAQLNSKNLQLSDQNSQFSAKVDANQNSIRLLHTRLAELSQQKDEVVCVTRQLQETSSRLEKEHLQQQSAWEREKQLMEQELRETKEKLLDLDSLAKEASALRTEKQSLSQPLHEAKIKVKNLELDLERAHSELDHLKREIRGQQQENLSLAQEMGSITKSLQEAKDRISQMHILETKLESMKQECQTLQGTQVRLEADLMESQEQLLEANTKLALSQSQHLQEVQQLKEQVCNAVPKNQLAQLQLELTEEQQKVQQLQEQLNAQNQEANKLMCEQQEEYKRLLKRMEERMEEVEQKLKSVRIMLQDKMNQLKEQFTKNAKSDLMVKDLYVENAQLMKALQITEQRQKGAERKNFLLDEKIAALNRVLRKIAPTSLS